MDKINFVNGQAPYLSADNLNQMQDNVENAIDAKTGNVLFESTQGQATGTISIPNIYDYDKISLIIGTAGGTGNIRREIRSFYTNGLTMINLLTGYKATTDIYQLLVADISVSNSGLTFEINTYINLSNSGVYMGGPVDYLKIYKVIGHTEV